MSALRVPRAAAAAWLLFAALSPAASYVPAGAGLRLGGVATRGLCGRAAARFRCKRPAAAASSMGLFGLGSDSCNEGEGDSWLRLLRLQAQLQAAVEQEQYQDAARLNAEIRQLHAHETEELVRRLSAAAAGVRRDMKHRRRRGDAPAERLQMDLDTAIAEEDFAAAARLRDEIRALEPTFGTEQNAVTDVSFLLNDLEDRLGKLRAVIEEEQKDPLLCAKAALEDALEEEVAPCVRACAYAYAQRV